MYIKQTIMKTSNEFNQSNLNNASALSLLKVFSTIVLIIAGLLLSSCTTTRYTCPTYAKGGTVQAKYNPMRR